VKLRNCLLSREDSKLCLLEGTPQVEKVGVTRSSGLGKFTYEPLRGGEEDDKEAR